MNWSARLGRRVAACRRCPRLVEYCARVAQGKRRAYRDHDYWGRPVPGYGDPGAAILVVGLAPAAHGANRTGRMFTGDGCDGFGAGDFLMRALHANGLANRPTSQAQGDGLVLDGVFLTAICRCAPPANRPCADEIANCAPFLHEEMEHLGPRVIVALGKLAFDQTLRVLAARGLRTPRPKPRFAHAARVDWDPPAPVLLAAYHPSRQNTQTRRLTPPMLSTVFRDARAICHTARN